MFYELDPKGQLDDIFCYPIIIQHSCFVNKVFCINIPLRSFFLPATLDLGHQLTGHTVLL